MKKLIDTDHPFFRPRWIRILVVAICVGWSLLEFTLGSGVWGTLFLGIGAYAAWAFFLDPDRTRAGAPVGEKDDAPPPQ